MQTTTSPLARTVWTGASPPWPSEEWKNGVGSALTAYAAGTGDWNAVVTAFVDGWAKEYKLANG